jgi:hypothetical protein
MIPNGRMLQGNGHGECDILSLLFLSNHPAELSACMMIGPVSPMSFAYRDTPPHVRSVAWQGGMYVQPRSHH